MSGSIALSAGQARNMVFAGDIRHDFKLLEVTDELLREIQSNDVVIKGVAATDEAVLCTNDKTYSLKYVETTNCLCLVPPSQDSDSSSQRSPEGPNHASPGTTQQGLLTQLQKNEAASKEQPPVVVRAMAKAHIEVVEVAPKLEVLERLVAESPYPQPSEEDPAGAGSPTTSGTSQAAFGYSLEELVARVQASREQIKAALNDLGAVQLAGRWRLVQQEYISHILQLAVLTAMEMDWSLAGLPLGAVCQELQRAGCHPAASEQCLRAYGSCVAAAGSGGGGGRESGGGGSGGHVDVMDVDAGEVVLKLDENKVCRHFAKQLLRSRSWPVHAFEAAWAEACPRGLAPSLEMLQGLGLEDGGNIKLFSVEDLPQDPAGRFAALFAERARWEWTALEPYLLDVKVPGQTAEALLLKYARGSQATPEAPLFYSAR